MGRRSINTTKSGKFMNPTDQARKEARKRELKKNKKQRLAVRTAVLKGKDPRKLLEDMEIIDKMEFDPTAPPKLNEKVLKEKRKKLMDTFDRVLTLYQREDPSFAVELNKSKVDYESRRMDLQIYYEQVRNTEMVELDQIPLPDGPAASDLTTSQIPLPSDIPIPGLPMLRPVQGILKKSGIPGPPPGAPPGVPIAIIPEKKPPGPPPGIPPSLSDEEDTDENEIKELESKVRLRKIRFEDDAAPGEEEVKSGVTPLQAMMLQMAGQQIPSKESEESASGQLVVDLSTGTIIPPGAPPGPPPGLPPMLRPSSRVLPPGPPPGRPPGVPPGPPPGLPMRARLPVSVNVSRMIHISTGMQLPAPIGLENEDNPKVLSAPPSISRPLRPHEEQTTNKATIEAKPQIKANVGDVTRFMPTSLKVRREIKDAKGRIIRHAPVDSSQSKPSIPVVQPPTKDDAYDQFMQEMQGFL